MIRTKISALLLVILLVSLTVSCGPEMLAESVAPDSGLSSVTEDGERSEEGLSELSGMESAEDDSSALNEPEDSLEESEDVSKSSGQPAEAVMELKSFESGGETLNYWLYIPEDPESGMPLIVFLHSTNEQGEDPEQILSTESLPKYLSDGSVRPRAYAVIPQLTPDCKRWAEKQEILLQLITAVETEYALCGKTVLTGHSIGGRGTWEIAAAHPDVFSAIAPLSGSVKATEGNAEKLKGLSVWAVVGENDTVVKPDSSIEMIEALRNAGGNARITVLEGAGHLDVPSVYLSEEIGLLNWLLEHM